MVNYLNTQPMLYGIEHSPVSKEIELVPDYPALVAQKLIDGVTDIGIIPVAVIPRLKEYHIVTDFCIGCDGPVASVCLFSEVPIEQVKTVLIDYQSRTSAALTKVLLRDYWKISPELVDTQNGYQQGIKGTTAGLVIGDRALEQRHHSPYIYDLGEAWKAHTGLPFVFAAWVSNKQLPASFIQSFNEALALGMQHISEVVAANPYPVFNLHDYYTRYISYELNAEKRKGLQQFLSLLTAPAVTG